MKRLLIKKLPPVLAIQLKRFDYDWERECAIKFNDYFEFPRELDMEPYTVAGVAKLEGSDVHPENEVLHQHCLSLVFKWSHLNKCNLVIFYIAEVLKLSLAGGGPAE